MHRVPPSTGRFWSTADRQAAGLALGLHRAVRRAGDDLGRVLGASLDKGVVLELGSAACRKSMGAPGAHMTRPQAHEAGPGRAGLQRRRPALSGGWCWYKTMYRWLHSGYMEPDGSTGQKKAPAAFAISA